VERRAHIAITVVVVLKSIQRNVELFSNGLGIGEWIFSDKSIPAILSQASKAKCLANTEIGALAIDTVVFAHDLVSGDAVFRSDRIAGITRFDCIKFVALWCKGELRVSARQP